jgi:hypothetical protein
VSQLKATDGPIGVTTPGTPVDGVAPVQRIVCVEQSQRSTNRSSSRNNPNVFEDFFFTMSSTSGPVEFYINSRDNLIGAEIFQSSSPEGPWTSTITSASALPITQGDVAAKGLRTLNNGARIEHLGSLDRKSTPSGTSWGTWLEDQFKLLWSHNPDRGIYYRIRIFKGPRDAGLFGGQGKRGTFGFKLCYPTDTPVNEINTATTTNFPLTYHGVSIGVGGGGRESPFLFEFHVH